MTAATTAPLTDAVTRPERHPGEEASPCSLGGQEVMALRRENDQLREAIRSRAVIDQAMGALILRFGVDDEAALALLRRWSQTSNTKLRTIADTLIHVVCQGAGGVPTDPSLAEWLDHQVRRPICDIRGRIVPS